MMGMGGMGKGMMQGQNAGMMWPGDAGNMVLLDVIRTWGCFPRGALN